jgi:Na+/melibiose symporter-like transporter
VAQFITAGIYAAAAVPGDPAWGYQVVFLSLAVMMIVGLLFYLFSEDAAPVR